MITSISDLIPGDDNIQTISGTVVSVSDDEFVLQDATGEVLVDVYDLEESGGNLDLGVGQQVTVVGDLDDEDFDARSVTLQDNASQPSPVPINDDGTSQPSPVPINDNSLQTVTNISDLIPEDDRIQIISGTVTSVSDDEFVLQDATGEVLVDVYDLEESQGGIDLGIGIGQEVTVVGDLDDEDFDAYGIALEDNASQPSPVPINDDSTSQPSPLPGNDGSLQTVTNISDLIPEDDRIQTISGTVTSVSDDEFTLQDPTGEVLVDAYDWLESGGDLDLGVGQEVTVVGDLDDEDFDARSITSPEDNSNLTLINFPSNVILTDQNEIITLDYMIENIDLYGGSPVENLGGEGLDNSDLIVGSQEQVDLAVNNSVESSLY
ncbi:MAG: DUF5666 domain-containing protein [Pleurocapsa sp. MO_226.B13]|nr:DUF5666 domain-containing protein [Pleurocapsa sp. MO_226.B13]